jgi:hypothetical protein
MNTQTAAWVSREVSKAAGTAVFLRGVSRRPPYTAALSLPRGAVAGRRFSRRSAAVHFFVTRACSPPGAWQVAAAGVELDRRRTSRPNCSAGELVPTQPGPGQWHLQAPRGIQIGA